MPDFSIQTINLNTNKKQAVAFGKGLEIKMKEISISVQGLAESVGCTVACIQGIIDGQLDDTQTLADQICEALGIGHETMILVGYGYFD